MRPVFIFSPLPPRPTGVAYYTHAIARELVHRWDMPVTVVSDDVPASTTQDYPVVHWRSFLYRPFPRQAVVLYQIGNSEFHDFIYPFLFTYPGVTVLHDFTLGHGRLRIYQKYHSQKELTEELTYSLGEMGEPLSRAITGGYASRDTPYYTLMNRTVVDASKMTVVHNPNTCSALRNRCPEALIRYIPMGLWDADRFGRVPPGEIARLRRFMGIGEQELILGSFGHITPYKGVNTVLKALKVLVNLRYPVRLLFVGFKATGIDPLQVAFREGLQNHVRFLQNVPNDDYRTFLHLVDVYLAIRFPPAGECSLSVLEAMAAGKVVLMNRHRFNAFFPEDACIQIHLSRGVEEIVNHLKRLVHNRQQMKSIGKRAQEYIQKHHAFDSMLEGYREIIISYDSLPGPVRDQKDCWPEHLQPLTQRVLAHTLGRFKHVPVTFQKILRKRIQLSFEGTER